MTARTPRTEMPRFGGDKTNRPNTAWDAGDGSVAILLTTPGFITHVDAADYPLVEGIRWNARIQRGNRTVYAYGFSRVLRKCVFMHNVLLPCADGYQPDHEDCNGLNNRRGNLRPATHGQNQANKPKRAGCSSKYKGVTAHSGGKWQARVRRDKKDAHLGYFKDEWDAALAYNLAAFELYGEFARLNDA